MVHALLTGVMAESHPKMANGAAIVQYVVMTADSRQVGMPESAIPSADDLGGGNHVDVDGGSVEHPKMLHHASLRDSP
jgi:hypothetical protein